MGTVFYKRSSFVTHLPEDYLYSPSHFWLQQVEERLWRIGYTKFATRMLGEIVDHQFEVKEGAPVSSGQIIGSIEGFKAISDLYCVVDGTFRGGNPALANEIGLVNKDCYGAGWLYLVEGTPDAKCASLEEYRRRLDTTIDLILAKQEAASGVNPT
jgi:glycine cleavage system H protein